MKKQNTFNPKSKVQNNYKFADKKGTKMNLASNKANHRGKR